MGKSTIYRRICVRPILEFSNPVWSSSLFRFFVYLAPIAKNLPTIKIPIAEFQLKSRYYENIIKWMTLHLSWEYCQQTTTISFFPGHRQHFALVQRLSEKHTQKPCLVNVLENHFSWPICHRWCSIESNDSLVVILCHILLFLLLTALLQYIKINAPPGVFFVKSKSF